MDRPRALLIDDGELDRVLAALERAELDTLRTSRHEVRDGLPMPCDLLVTNGPHTLAMPSLSVTSPGPAPTWVCVHTQDFHPLRERLRALGVHYLVQAGADDRTLDLFVGQLLHRGSERRREPRLPVGCELTWTWKSRSNRKGALLDLSARGVRIAVEEDLPVGAVLDLQLPSQLTGEPLDVAARVSRCEPSSGADGDRSDVLLLWDELEPERRRVIDEIVSGNRIGPRVAPLAPRPYVDGAGIPDWGEMQSEAERRHASRHAYTGHVDAFADSGPIGALGRDLSVNGVRIEAHDASALEIGENLTLALHPGDSAEPLLVAARVARRDEDGALVMLFGTLDDQARAGIERMLEALPALAHIGDTDRGSDDDARVFAAEITRG